MQFDTHMNIHGGPSPWMKTMLCAGCAAAALIASSSASAQNATGAAASGGVDEIVVTAQRRVERSEDVPISLTRLSPEALEKANVVNIRDISRITPGVQINNGGAYMQPSIRGITALTNGNGNENNVAFYVDGFFVSDNSSINTDLANISSILVLKGPQGTLYGRQAAGGAILINTLDPTPEFSGRIEGRYARWDEKRVAGYLSGPISEKLLFMVSGSFRNSDGWLKLASRTDPTKTDGDAAPQKQRIFRSKLLFKPTEDLDVTLAYNYAKTSDTPSSSQYTVKEHIPNTSGNVVNRLYGFYTKAWNYRPFQVSETNQVTLKIQWDNSIGTLTSYTGQDWRRNRSAFDFDGGYVDFSFSDGENRQKAFQQALDFNITAIENLDLIVGGLYFDDHYYPGPKGGSENYGPGKVLVQRVAREVWTDAIAFYADANYHVTDKLTIGVGGRYNIDKKRYHTHSDFPVVNNPYQTTDAKKTFRKFTPRAIIRYEVADRSNIYFSFAQGYKAGSFNANGSPFTAIASVPIEPEVVTAYELGFKTAQRWWRLETSAFYYDYKDLNISLTIQNPLGPAFGAATVIGNAPKSKIYGADIQVVVEPVEKLNITAGATWLHARYGNFPNASGVGVDPTNTFNINQPTQDWTHLQMARAPDFSANLNVDYTVPLAGGQLRMSGNVRYTDSFVPTNPAVYGPVAPVELRDKQRFRQPHYATIDAELQWNDPTNHFWVGVFGTNLTSVKVKLSYTGTAAGSYYLSGAPIAYGVKAGYKF